MFAEWPLLSLVIWAPIVGGCLVLATGSDKYAPVARLLALLVSVITFLLSIPLWTGFEIGTAEMQFVERSAEPWIATFNIYYHLGIDGISLPLIMLTTLSTVIVVIAGWEVIKERVAQYMAAFLFMEGWSACFLHWMPPCSMSSGKPC